MDTCFGINNGLLTFFFARGDDRGTGIKSLITDSPDIETIAANLSSDFITERSTVLRMRRSRPPPNRIN